MALEIERKFRVVNNSWREHSRAVRVTQAYICNQPEKTIRLRIINEEAFLTIKSENTGLVRSEFEYPVLLADAEEMIRLFCAGQMINKTRHLLTCKGKLWEVDEFHGYNQGLVIAEVELEHADEKVELPDWIGEEVTGDPRYYNVNLVSHPYSKW
jgi:CYTH domain-containing protein